MLGILYILFFIFIIKLFGIGINICKFNKKKVMLEVGFRLRLFSL